MSEPVEIEPQGGHEYLVRLSGEGEGVESWFRVNPETLTELGATPSDEAAVVRQTVDFLLRRQSVPDFPRIVELEDVLASYDDFRASMARS